MKFIVALLLGVSLSFAAISPQPELDWDDIEDAEDKQYKGLIVQVYKEEDGAPKVALGSEFDDFEEVYCLNLLALFESQDYNTTTGEYGAITGSYRKFTNCSVSEISSTQFNIVCDLNPAVLTLSFTFTTDAEGDNGLEYVITLENYTLPTNQTKLVLVQSLEDCSDLYDIDSWDADDDDNDDDEDEDDVDTEDTADDVNDDDRRRLMRDEGTTDDDADTEVDDTDDTEDVDDDDDDESDDDSDDSNEVDFGFSRFVSSGQAVDQCGATSTNIGSAVVQQSELDQVHLVFDYFECSLVLDPFWGLDNSKLVDFYLNKDHAASTTITTFAALILSVLAFALYL